MDWIALYPELKRLHITLAAASVTLFAARGAAVLAGGAWPLRRAARLASVGIDTLLLMAGVTLWWMLQLHPGRDRWLFAKLLLIAVYIGVGSLALKSAWSRRARAGALAAALACIAAVAAIALSHDALAPLRWLGL